LGIRENGAWRQDTCSYCPDIVYSQAANFQISLTLPPDWLVASNLDQTGVLENEKNLTQDINTTTAPQKNAQLTHVLSSLNLPVRDIALVISPRLQVESRTFGEVEVKVYTLQDEAGVDDAMTEQIFSMAEGSLHLFSERFGPYLYRALSLVIFPGAGTSGEEYPGLAFLYLKKDAERLPSVVAHEIAHQWWYGVVGSDIYREPWLDESLAEYSAVLYLEQTAGAQAAQASLEEFRNDVQVLSLSTGKDWKVGSSVLDFPDFDIYETVIYHKGPLFLDALRQEIGDEAFFSGLQQYYEWYKFGIGTGQGFLEAMQQASGKDLLPLFDEWVGLDNLR
jgi:aminopeptidase N